MVTYGQTKLNRKEVRKGTIRFAIAFVILTVMSFFSVYLFFKSSQIQNREIITDLNNYKNIVSRNDLLKTKMDTIYEKMGYFGTERLKNDIFLTNNILDDINTCRSIMGSDSTKEFAQYNKFFGQMTKMLSFKNRLIKINTEEKVAERKLMDCSGKVDQVQKPSNLPVKKKGKLVK